ncbi:MAG TPA: ribonuclease HII [Candidatus Krumholzibacterium sp.]|nr:ribonuclease HII [Candidatus Krumholzibacterium sp.]
MSPGDGAGFEQLTCFDAGYSSLSGGCLAGVDEAGRGALAGPVVAAAVICSPDPELSRVRDSKLLSEPVREELYEVITRKSTAWAVGIVPPEEIDRINILKATLKAMRNAIEGLALRPGLVLIDGIHPAGTVLDEVTVKGGDRKSFSVAAASIVAKVTRDRIMRSSDEDHPGYNFARNKGYGTAEHIDAIRTLGRSSIHRMTFKTG